MKLLTDAPTRLTKAQIDRIRSLETRSGRISAKKVVEDARRPSSPLHKLFDWRVRAAAERWWLHRARQIIGLVQYEVTTSTTVVHVPAYVANGRGEGYRSTVSLKADTVAARESLIYTLEVAAGHVRRALDLAGPLGLQGEIDELLQRIVGVQRVARGQGEAGPE